LRGDLQPAISIAAFTTPVAVPRPALSPTSAAADPSIEADTIFFGSGTPLLARRSWA
jgi:hypothetical protein